MNELTVFRFLEEKKDYLFPNDMCSEMDLENALLIAPDSFEYQLKTISLRDPSKLKLIAIFPGSLGVDRFMLGDVKNGILKYFTLAGLGIWWIVDIFSAKNRCRAYNCKNIMNALANPSFAAQSSSKFQAGFDAAVNIGKSVAPIVKSMAQDAKDIGSTFEIK